MSNLLFGAADDLPLAGTEPSWLPSGNGKSPLRFGHWQKVQSVHFEGAVSRARRGANAHCLAERLAAGQRQIASAAVRPLARREVDFAESAFAAPPH